MEFDQRTVWVSTNALRAACLTFADSRPRPKSKARACSSYSMQTMPPFQVIRLLGYNETWDTFRVTTLQTL